jgi:hypothetical protein
MVSKNTLSFIIKKHLLNHVSKEDIVKALPLKLLNSSAFLLAIALLAGCNQSNHDTTPPSIINIVPVKISDTTKPVLNISNASLVMGVILPNNATPSSFVIAPKGRITATDNNGTATLSVRQVVGLSAEQVQLAADGTLSAINILPTQAIGRGYVVVRATDSSGNYTDSKVYFDILPSTASTQANVTVGQSLTLQFPVMANSQQANVSLPTNPTGISGVANLAGNELIVSFNTNNSAVAGELKPKISVKTATGEVYSFVLTVNVQAAVPVDNTPPSKLSEDEGLEGLGVAGYAGVGSITFNEPIASVSDVKFVDSVTGVTLTGGSATAKVSEANSMVVNVEYKTYFFWIGLKIMLCFNAKDLSMNSSTVCSNKYELN